MNAPRFVWNELVSADPGKSRDFYASLFGWETEPFGTDGKYLLFKKGEAKLGGLIACPQPGSPSHWLPYVAVDDLDAALAQATSLGAAVVLPPMEIPTVGRIAIVTDPLGAPLGLGQFLPCPSGE